MGAFSASDADPNRFLTWFEFASWATKEIEKSKELSFVISVPWKFGKYSDFQRRDMSVVHKFRIGT